MPPAKRQKRSAEGPEYSRHFPQKRVRGISTSYRDEEHSGDIWEVTTTEDPPNHGYSKGISARTASGSHNKKSRLLHATEQEREKLRKVVHLDSDDEPIPIADSQDRVIVDDLADDGPPPADIQSDIMYVQSGKRGRVAPVPGPSVRKVKRTSPSESIADGSEDELSRAPSLGKARATNLSALQRRERPQLRSRADIQPSRFTGTKASVDTLEESACWLDSAACGRNLFRASGRKSALVQDDNHDWRLVLRSEEGNWEASTANWLSMPANSIQIVYHNATHSSYVRILSTSRIGSGRALNLQFTCTQAAVNFLNSVGWKELRSEPRFVPTLQSYELLLMSKARNYRQSSIMRCLKH
jgi:hypothetical protein